MNWHAVEEFRNPHPMGLTHKNGDPFGWFEIPSCYDRKILRVQAFEGDEKGLPNNSSVNFGKWDHVSVSKVEGRTPLWREMCQIKDLFWNDEDCIVQFHPPKSQYVNFTANCLHLWKLKDGIFPMPASIEVGPIERKT